MVAVVSQVAAGPVGGDLVGRATRAKKPRPETLVRHRRDGGGERVQVMEGTPVDKGIPSTIQATWHVWDLSRKRRGGIRKHWVTKIEADAKAGHGDRLL